MRVFIAALLGFAALSSSASGAPVRALAPAGSGPVLDGRDVRFESGGTVFLEPLWGGVRTQTPAMGVLAPLSPPLGDVSPFSVVEPVQQSALGVVTLEADGVWLRRGGRRVEVALPPGADPSVVAVAGNLGVAPVPEGALVVFDLRSGAEVRQVSLGAYDPVNLDGLAVSASGDVAATVPAGDGTGVLVWAPAGASRVRELATGGSRLGRVAVAGGRVAYVTGAGLREGVRVVVVDPAAVRDPTAGARAAASPHRATGPAHAVASRRAAAPPHRPRGPARALTPRRAAASAPAARGEVLRGPAVYDVTSLSFDGAWVGFATPSCLYVASASGATLPAGPCPRTVVAAERLRGASPRLRVACINAAARTCRVRASARGRTVTATVRRGQARVISVPRGQLRVRTVDPDGREARVL